MNLFKKLKHKYIFNFASTKIRFEEIYSSNFWQSKESVSGPGSQLELTQSVRAKLPIIIKEFNFKSLLDLPCGDFHWMSKFNLSEIQYIGGDIVPALIKRNNDIYKSENITFIELDLISDVLPKVDAIFIRDCFIHLSEKQIFAALMNIKSSGIKFMITNNYPDFETNFDIKTGMFRKVNFSKSPYDLRGQVFEVEEIEHYSEIDGRKMIVVYDCSKL